MLSTTVMFIMISHKENVKAARFLRDTAIEKETITQFVKLDGIVRDPGGESSQREGQQFEGCHLVFTFAMLECQGRTTDL